MIAFLEALSDDSFDRKIPESVPSGLAVGGRIRKIHFFRTYVEPEFRSPSMFRLVSTFFTIVGLLPIVGCSTSTPDSSRPISKRLPACATRTPQHSVPKTPTRPLPCLPRTALRWSRTCRTSSAGRDPKALHGHDGGLRYRHPVEVGRDGRQRQLGVQPRPVLAARHVEGIRSRPCPWSWTRVKHRHPAQAGGRRLEDLARGQQFEHRAAASARTSAGEEVVGGTPLQSSKTVGPDPLPRAGGSGPYFTVA